MNLFCKLTQHTSFLLVQSASNPRQEQEYKNIKLVNLHWVTMTSFCTKAMVIKATIAHQYRFKHTVNNIMPKINCNLLHHCLVIKNYWYNNYHKLRIISVTLLYFLPFSTTKIMSQFQIVTSSFS